MSNGKPTSSKQNFLSQFRDPETHAFQKMSAKEFLDCWQHFDTDGNGYLEGDELKSFLREFITSVIPDRLGEELMPAIVYQQFQQEFMDAFDVDEDGRLSITEMSEVLPADEAFVALFCNEMPLTSSVEFVRIWRRFDRDSSGYIEANELTDFLRHLLSEGKVKMIVTEDKLNEYSSTILTLFDKDRDGRLHVSELARLLRVKENYLRKPILNSSVTLCGREIEQIFNHYDSDENGYLEEEEIDGLLKDYVELYGLEFTEEILTNLRTKIFNTLDENHDGKIRLDELRSILTFGTHFSHA